MSEGRRRRGTVGGRPALGEVVSVPVRRSTRLLAEVTGVDLSGAAVTVGVLAPGRWALLLFLASSCDACAPFWQATADPRTLGLLEGDRLVTLTRPWPHEDPAVLERLVRGAGEHARAGSVVMSARAWADYGVLGPPFFVLADGTLVASEGVAWSPGQVAADVRRARSGGMEERSTSLAGP